MPFSIVCLINIALLLALTPGIRPGQARKNSRVLLRGSLEFASTAYMCFVNLEKSHDCLLRYFVGNVVIWGNWVAYKGYPVPVKPNLCPHS